MILFESLKETVNASVMKEYIECHQMAFDSPKTKGGRTVSHGEFAIAPDHRLLAFWLPLFPAGLPRPVCIDFFHLPIRFSRKRTMHASVS